MLDSLIPTPRLLEVDSIELSAPPERVWQELRHGNLASSPLVRALFALRTLPDRLRGHHPETTLRLDDLSSTPEQPGFQLLLEEPGIACAVGAIGKVWQERIPFVHVSDAGAFRDFTEPDFAKVAWSIHVSPRGEHGSLVEFELRVDTTDPAAWPKFERYFRLIGPGSHFIRRSVLASLAHRLGTPEAEENQRPLPGDDLLPDATAQVTECVTLSATPERVWPWLLQLGCRRGGFYAIDVLDNGGERSARELDPDLLKLELGQVLPATPESNEGFEVLRVSDNHVLILGGLYDPVGEHQLAFSATRPERYWQVTWAFVLEPLDAHTTRLHVRARAAFPAEGRLHARAIRPVHHFMQRAMLLHLAERVEGRLPRDDFHDVLAGLSGAALMLAAFSSPFLRARRSHWGVDEATAARSYPGDALVERPRWGWTHGVEIDAPAGEVWAWVAQMGADRGGFYSYQWLENLAGCELQNAEVVHPEWQAKLGDRLLLHPKAPSLRVVALESGRYLLASSEPQPDRREPWANVTWLFSIEALGERRCRLISRYRADFSDGVAARLSFGPLLLEPIGFAMDRRMLLGVKGRAERTRARRAASKLALDAD